MVSGYAFSVSSFHWPFINHTAFSVGKPHHFRNSGWTLRTFMNFWIRRFSYFLFNFCLIDRNFICFYLCFYFQLEHSSCLICIRQALGRRFLGFADWYLFVFYYPFSASSLMTQLLKIADDCRSSCRFYLIIVSFLNVLHF